MMVVALLVAVERRLLRFLDKSVEILYELTVPNFRDSGHQYPLPRIFGIVQLVLSHRLVVGLHHGAGVAQAGGEAHHDGNAVALRQFKAISRHIVGLLLIGGLKAWHHGEIRIETGILLILRGMHGGIVGSYHEQAAVGSRHRRIDERIGSHIDSHMFHRCNGTQTAVTHAESLLDGGLFIRRPVAVDFALAGYWIFLDIFQNFCRRCARIRVCSRKPRIDGSESKSFVAQ